MSNRSYDVIVFGATGNLGRRICKFIYENSVYKRWAIMAPSHAKLSVLMQQLRETNASGILPDLLISDAQDFRSLRDILVETRLLLNCVRPYRTLGKDIIEACLMARTDYMDLCSETYFIESNFLEFHEEAKKKSVFIIHACGFDSALSNLGVLFTIRNFSPDECNSIESFLTISAPEGFSGDYNTYETLMYNQKNSGNIKGLRTQIEDKFKLPGIAYPGPRIAKKGESVLDKRVDKFILPHFGPDVAIMNQGIKTLALNTHVQAWPQYHSYIAVNDYYLASTAAFYSNVCSTLASFTMGRYLLKNFPESFTDGVITHNGPTEAQLQASTFNLQFIARGFALFSEDISKNILTEEQKLLKKQEESSVSALNRDQNTIITEEQQQRLYEATHKSTPTRTIIPRNDLNETILTETMGSPLCSNIFTSSGGDGSTKGGSGSSRKGKNTYNNDLTGKVPIEMRVSVSGPEPYYITTSAVFVTLASVLVEERNAQRENIYSTKTSTNNTSSLYGTNISVAAPVVSTANVGVAAVNILDASTVGTAGSLGKVDMPCGGVFTPASAFYHSTTVFNKLREIGIDFKVHSNVSVANGGGGEPREEPVAAKYATDKDLERRTNMQLFDDLDVTAVGEAAPLSHARSRGDVDNLLASQSLLSSGGSADFGGSGAVGGPGRGGFDDFPAEGEPISSAVEHFASSGSGRYGGGTTPGRAPTFAQAEMA